LIALYCHGSLASFCRRHALMGKGDQEVSPNLFPNGFLLPPQNRETKDPPTTTPI
jgi:hypothetical protein